MAPESRPISLGPWGARPVTILTVVSWGSSAIPKVGDRPLETAVPSAPTSTIGPEMDAKACLTPSMRAIEFASEAGMVLRAALSVGAVLGDRGDLFTAAHVRVADGGALDDPGERGGHHRAQGERPRDERHAQRDCQNREDELDQVRADAAQRDTAHNTPTEVGTTVGEVAGTARSWAAGSAPRSPRTFRTDAWVGEVSSDTRSPSSRNRIRWAYAAALGSWVTITTL